MTEAAEAQSFCQGGFKKAVKASPTLADDTDKPAGARGVIEALAIAAKAGRVVSGFTKVEDALRRGTVGGLLHASNGAPPMESAPDSAPATRHLTRNPATTRRNCRSLRALSSDAIGFGIGAVKCDTCCRAYGPGGQERSCRGQTWSHTGWLTTTSTQAPKLADNGCAGDRAVDATIS